MLRQLEAVVEAVEPGYVVVACCLQLGCLLVVYQNVLVVHVVVVVLEAHHSSLKGVILELLLLYSSIGVIKCIFFYFGDLNASFEEVRGED